MGELQSRYKQRLAEVTQSHQAQPEAQFLLTALRAELKGTVF